MFEKAFGADAIAWLDGKWPALGKAVYSRKKISQFVDDEELGTFLYDEGLRFGTEYPITEKTLAAGSSRPSPSSTTCCASASRTRRRSPTRYLPLADRSPPG